MAIISDLDKYVSNYDSREILMYDMFPVVLERTIKSILRPAIVDAVFLSMLLNNIFLVEITITEMNSTSHNDTAVSFFAAVTYSHE